MKKKQISLCFVGTIIALICVEVKNNRETGINRMSYYPEQPFWPSNIKNFQSHTVAPSGVLAQYYNFTAPSEEDQVFTAVPDGTVDIFFRCSETDPAAMVYGSVLKGKRITLKKDAHYFGVRFFPGAAEQVLGCPLDLFTDQDVQMGDVQKCAEKLVERISQAGSFEERIRLFTEYQANCCQKYDSLPSLVSWAKDRINSAAGNIRIQDLADESGYSSRYVNKPFQEAYRCFAQVL